MSQAVSTDQLQTSPAEPDDAAGAYWGLSLEAWAKIGVVAGLFIALFWPNLRRLWEKTNPIYGEPNWGHSVAVPLIGLYYLYLNREALLSAAVKPLLLQSPLKNRLIGVGVVLAFAAGSYFVAPQIIESFKAYFEYLGIALGAYALTVLVLNWSIGSIVFGLVTFAAGIWPVSNDYVKDLGMVITLFGVVLTLCGWEVMKVAWFPIAFLICALPLPGLLYSQIALPLQHLAARVAVAIMQTAGVFATYAGTKITVGLGTADSPIRTLNVAEACAGMRSLMTFISVGAAVAFLSSRPLWQRLFITASAVPIAIFCNVLRVTGQGFLEAYGYRDMASGFAHQFVGLVMLIPAFFLILLVGWILDQLFIEEVDVEKDVLKKGVVVRGGVIERRPTAFEVTASNADAAPAPAAAQTTAPEVKPAAPSSIPLVIPPRPNLGRPTPPPKATARRPIVPPTTGGHPSSTGVSKP